MVSSKLCFVFKTIKQKETLWLDSVNKMLMNWTNLSLNLVFDVKNKKNEWPNKIIQIGTIRKKYLKIRVEFSNACLQLNTLIVRWRGRSNLKKQKCEMTNWMLAKFDQRHIAMNIVKHFIINYLDILLIIFFKLKKI